MPGWTRQGLVNDRQNEDYDFWAALETAERYAERKRRQKTVRGLIRDKKRSVAVNHNHEPIDHFEERRREMARKILDVMHRFEMRGRYANTPAEIYSDLDVDHTTVRKVLKQYEGKLWTVSSKPWGKKRRMYFYQRVFGASI